VQRHEEINNPLITDESEDSFKYDAPGNTKDDRGDTQTDVEGRGDTLTDVEGSVQECSKHDDKFPGVEFFGVSLNALVTSESGPIW
jgi:hypothetical protein